MAALDWIPAAQKNANDDVAFRNLGSADATVYFQSGKYARRVAFEAFKVKDVSTVDTETLVEQEIVISMTTREWNSYLYNRRMRRAPNLLALDADKHIIKTKNPMARLAYERISRSVQAFVDYGALSRS